MLGKLILLQNYMAWWSLQSILQYGAEHLNHQDMYCGSHPDILPFLNFLCISSVNKLPGVIEREKAAYATEWIT